MARHFRKDNPGGITPPNLDGLRDVIAHITKHRGMKTPYTSVSEDAQAIRRFRGIMYETDSDPIVQERHDFITHFELVEILKTAILNSSREDKVTASRAYLLASNAKEALIDWRFDLERIERKDRIAWCARHIRKFFRRA